MLGHEARYLPSPSDIGYSEWYLMKAGKAEGGAQYLSSSLTIVSVYLNHNLATFRKNMPQLISVAHIYNVFTTWRELAAILTQKPAKY